MEKGMRTVASWLCLAAMLLAGCGTAGNTPDDNAAAAHSNSSLEASLPTQAMAATAAVSSVSAASSNPRNPNMPPEEAFLPWTPDPAQPLGEPEGWRTALRAAPKFGGLAHFNGLLYDAADNNRYAIIRGTLSSEEDVFFLLENTLYYSNGQGISRVMDNVYCIVGSDRSGIYLIVEDQNVPVLGNEEKYYYHTLQSSLIRYDPVDETATTVLSNVEDGILCGENRDVLFYCDTEPYACNSGFRYVIKRQEMSFGTERIVLADACNYRNPGGTGGLDGAVNVDIALLDANIHVTMDYPYPSEILYARHLLVNLNGDILGDSDQAEVVVDDKGYLATAIHNDQIIYHLNPDAVPVGGYPLRLTRESGSNFTFNYLVEQDTLEYYWRWDSIANIATADGLLYSCAAMYLSPNGAPVTVYDGSLNHEIDFWEEQVVGMSVCGGNVYFCAWEKGGSTGREEGGNWLALYQAVGTEADPAAIRFICAFEKEHWDVFDFVDNYKYAPAMYTAGYFLLLCTRKNENVAVLDTRTGTLNAMGADDVTFRAA